jgi:hypothetical protein
MANKSAIEPRLRKKLSRLLKRSGSVGSAMSVLKAWEERGWGPILFGGVIRDLVVLGGRHYPRDVDVVLRSGTTEDLIEEFQPHEYNLNRFGGLHLNVNRWSFDVWPLEKTWAFSNDNSMAPTPANLPKTTFLNVEAVAVTLNGPSRIGQIYSNGFFQALEDRVVGINYRDNPFPALCAVRALATAYKLYFRISSELARYFIDAAREFGASELVHVQEQHYGRVIFRAHEITQLEEYFMRTLDSDGVSVIPMPDSYHPTQLHFWAE